MPDEAHLARLIVDFLHDQIEVRGILGKAQRLVEIKEHLNLAVADVRHQDGDCRIQARVAPSRTPLQGSEQASGLGDL